MSELTTKLKRGDSSEAIKEKVAEAFDSFYDGVLDLKRLGSSREDLHEMLDAFYEAMTYRTWTIPSSSEDRTTA